MSFNKVILINPSYAGSHWGAVRPPVGLGYLSEMFTSKGIEHRIVDMSLGYKKRDLFGFIERFKPDIVGLSLLSFRYKDTYNLIKNLKERFPSVSIVVGGPHVTTNEKKILEDVAHIDFCITKEGELSLIELIQGDRFKTNGLIFRNGRKICYNNSNTFIDDLDSIPFPRYRKFSLKKYVAREIGIITSRGCPYNCIFCQETLGKRFRMRSAGGVVEEIDYWFREGYRDILILDDNFTMDEGRALEICAGLGNNNLKGLRLRLANGVRADRVNKRLLTGMWDAGFRYISFGVEGGNNRVLKAIGKGERIEEIREAISLAVSIGFEVTLFFLVGSPEERREDVEDSVTLAQQFPVFDAKFYNPVPFPRTKLYDWVKENNFFVERPEEYLNNASHWDNRPVFATPWFTKAQRRDALVYTRGIRRKIRRRAIERRLRRIAPLNHAAGWLFSLEVVQEILQSNRVIRRLLQDFFHGIKDSYRS